MTGLFWMKMYHPYLWVSSNAIWHLGGYSLVAFLVHDTLPVPTVAILQTSFRILRSGSGAYLCAFGSRNLPSCVAVRSRNLFRILVFFEGLHRHDNGYVPTECSNFLQHFSQRNIFSIGFIHTDAIYHIALGVTTVLGTESDFHRMKSYLTISTILCWLSDFRPASRIFACDKRSFS